MASVAGTSSGSALHHLEAVAFDAHDLLRVVGEDLEVLDAQVHQDLRADAVVTKVGAEAERVVGLDRVLALILELVGLELVEQADPAPFLAHVDEDAAPLVLDDGQRLVELGAAVAAVGAEDVAGEALGVHADQHRLVGLDVAQHQGQGQAVVHRGLVGDDLVSRRARWACG